MRRTSTLSNYPNSFGSIMEGRSYEGDTSLRYRFGFNSQEKDDEIYGEGNSYDFGARIYDGRLGRWLSLDPLLKDYPGLSNYSFVANSPLIFIDKEGKKIVISGDATFVANTIINLAKIYGTERGKMIIERLQASDIEYKIEECFFTTSSQYDTDKNALQYDDSPIIGSLDGGAVDEDGLIGLSHELYHAYQDETFQTQSQSDITTERDAVAFQNYITSVYSLGDVRLYYSGKEGGEKGKFFSPHATEKTFNPDNEKISDFKYNSNIEVVNTSTGNSDIGNLYNKQIANNTCLSPTISYTKTESATTKEQNGSTVTSQSSQKVKNQPVPKYKSN